MRTKKVVSILAIIIILLITTLALFAKSIDDCQTHRRTMYVETGSLSKCIRQNGLYEYVNVRRLDGTYSEYPNELHILMIKYMEFHYAFNFEPASLTDKDYETFRKLQKMLLAYNKNDISFMYEYLNQ